METNRNETFSHRAGFICPANLPERGNSQGTGGERARRVLVLIPRAIDALVQARLRRAWSRRPTAVLGDGLF
jgi:hypothetical protein